MTAINTNPLKRLGIFFLYDPDGIADDSVLYFLSKAKSCFSTLLVVANGTLNQDSKDKLQKITPHIIIRENNGYDVWAYKEALNSLGWVKITSYDELTLFNFTNFGPFYSLNEMFDEMSTKAIDFWGITKYHKHMNIPGKKDIPEHIQSHWISIKKDMLCSKEFKEYWDNIPKIDTYEDAIYKHEVIFTSHFHSIGFTYDVYVDTSKLTDPPNDPLLSLPYTLLTQYRCPIIKKKSFFLSYEKVLKQTMGHELANALDFIKKSTNYDTNIIWDNILRLHNYADIKNNLHCNYILPSSHSFLTPEENLNQKIALIIHIYFIDMVDYCFSYAQNIQPNFDVYITTDSLEKKEVILRKFSDLRCKKIEVLIVQNRGRDVSSLLVGCKDILRNYDLICFAHDKKTAHEKPSSLGSSFSYRCWNNVLYNNFYIQNIILTFINNERLGFLFAPPPHHGGHVDHPRKWFDNFNNTISLAKKLNISVPISEDKEPIAPLGTIFWFRTKALSPLLVYDWNYDDFPEEPNKTDGTILHAIERLYPYAAQQAGFYPAWCMNDKFAALEIENLSWIYTHKSDKKESVTTLIYLLYKAIARNIHHYFPLLFRMLYPIHLTIRYIKKTCQNTGNKIFR